MKHFYSYTIALSGSNVLGLEILNPREEKTATAPSRRKGADASPRDASTAPRPQSCLRDGVLNNDSLRIES